MVIARALVKEEPPGKLLPVELSKQIFVTDVCQQLDHLLEGVLNGLITQLLSATLQVAATLRQVHDCASHPIPMSLLLAVLTSCVHSARCCAQMNDRGYASLTKGLFKDQQLRRMLLLTSI